MINKVILIGRVGKAPEYKSLESGVKVATFSVATSENYKNKNGEWVEKTEWHRVSAWAAFAEKAESLTVGTLIYLEGKLQTRKWQDKQGDDRYTTEIVASYYRTLKKPGENTKPNTEPSGADLPF